MRRVLSWTSTEMNKHTPTDEGEPTYSVTDKNVLGEPLEFFSLERVTCFVDENCCLADGESDALKNVVCCLVTEEFLEFVGRQNQGSETSNPDQNVGGLKPGERLYLCAKSWFEAYHAGCAPKVVLEATHQDVLTHMSSEILTALAEQSKRKSF